MLNSVDIQGRLTKDPEIRNTSNQIAVASFTLACDRPFKDNNGNKQTDFISCVAWRNTATFIGQYFHKGDMLIAHGRIQTRSYDDNQGKKVYVTELLVEEANFGGGQKTETKPAPEEQSVYGAPEVEERELPFDI